MKKLLTVPVLLSAMIMAGCASSPEQFNPDKSEAYNIAHAGGLHQDIKDTEIPASQFNRLSEAMLDVGDATAGFLNPVLGMSNWQSLGLQVLGLSFKADTHGSRSSLLAWMPESEAGSKSAAEVAMVSYISNAIVNATESMGGVAVEGKRTSKHVRNGVYVFNIVNPKWNCDLISNTVPSETCAIAFRVVPPKQGLAPTFVGGDGKGKSSYFFSGNSNYSFSRVAIGQGDDASMPEDELMAGISANLPSWAYLYNAPKTLQTKDGESVPYPYILSEGQTKLFVVPEK